MPDLFLNQYITYVQRRSTDKWGDSTYQTLYSNVKCRMSFTVRRDKLAVSEQDVVVAICYVSGDYVMKEDDRVYFDSEYYLVMRVEKNYDLFGNLHHYKILLKSR